MFRRLKTKMHVSLQRNSDLQSWVTRLPSKVNFLFWALWSKFPHIQRFVVQTVRKTLLKPTTPHRARFTGIPRASHRLRANSEEADLALKPSWPARPWMASWSPAWQVPMPMLWKTAKVWPDLDSDVLLSIRLGWEKCPNRPEIWLNHAKPRWRAGEFRPNLGTNFQKTWRQQWPPFCRSVAWADADDIWPSDILRP